jgi:hypothetical protein
MPWRRRRGARQGGGGDAGSADGLPPLQLRAADQIADNQTKQLALLSASAVPVRREYLLAGNEYYYRGPPRTDRPETEARRLPRIRKQGRATRQAAAGRHRARLCEGQQGRGAVRRRGPHRAHGEEREAQAAAGRSLRHHRRAQADRLQAHRRQPDRIVLAHRAAQRQGRGGDGTRAGAHARRLGDGAGIAEAHQRVGARPPRGTWPCRPTARRRCWITRCA